MKHQWIVYHYESDEVKDEIDVFQFEEGHHNGPKCLVCGFFFCQHCHPEYYDAECTGQLILGNLIGGEQSSD